MKIVNLHLVGTVLQANDTATHNSLPVNGTATQNLQAVNDRHTEFTASEWHSHKIYCHWMTGTHNLLPANDCAI